MHENEWLSEAETEALARLKRLYLKAPDGDAEGTDSLQSFFKIAIHSYTTGIAADPGVPHTLQNRLRQDLDSLDRTLSRALAESTLKAFDRPVSFPAALLETQETLVQNTNRLSNILWKHDLSFRGYLALEAQSGSRKYLFLSERTAHSCSRCEALHGHLFSLETLAAEAALPPLHPNCQCRLVAIDSAAEYLYNIDRDGFYRRLDRLFDEAGMTGGGIFALAPGARAIRPIRISEAPAVRDREHSAPKWYEQLGAWASKFGADMVSFIDAFFARGESLFVRASETLDENFLLGMLQWADALAFGIASGMLESLQHNYETWQNEPSVYSFLNCWLAGLPELLQDALFPEEPLSFQHVMNLIGVATILVGTAKLLSSGSLDDMARAAAGNLDDQLDDIARRNGKVEAILSADDLNDALIKVGDKPSYAPGTRVYYVEYAGETPFVRVYGGKSGQVGRWFMSADDIAGLTAEQIRNKFSLPQTPTKICDVTVPYGAHIEISSAGGIMGGRGGGVQYRFIDKYDENWLVNGRTLP